MGIEQIVVDVIEKHPDVLDPRDLAALAVKEVPSRELRTVLEQLLPDLVRHLYRTIHARTEGRRDGIPGSSRWRRLAEAVEDREFVPRVGWVLRKDLTAEQCRAIGADYFDRATRNEAAGKGWYAIADRMDRAGVSRLGELNEAVA